MQPPHIQFFMQVVPLGTEWAVEVCYARLARNVGSKYMEYRIQTEESSLIENYNKDDMVIRDPVALKGKDWSLMTYECIIERTHLFEYSGLTKINFASILLRLDLIGPV